VLRGRSMMATESTDRLERSQPGRDVRRGQESPEIRAEGEYEVDATGGNAWAAQTTEHGRRLEEIHAGAKVPFHERMGIRSLREDPELRHGHRASDPIDERSSDLTAEPGELLDDRLELAIPEDQQLDVAIGDGGGGARAAVDERDLAQEFAGSEAGESQALTLHDDMPAQDDEELVPALALAHQDFAIGCPDFSG